VNINPNRFAKEVGYKRPDTIYNVYTGRTRPSREMLKAIAARFTDLNMNWLTRGAGTTRGSCSQGRTCGRKAIDRGA
jgi:hypothetical protein